MGRRLMTNVAAPRTHTAEGPSEVREIGAHVASNDHQVRPQSWVRMVEANKAENEGSDRDAGSS